MFPYYRGVFDGAGAAAGDTALRLFLRQHILLANFERDTKAQAAILKIVSDSLGRPLKTVCIERLTGSAAKLTNEEELF